MFSTLASLTFWQAKNRVRVRLARLKQPRYLVGSIFGIAYIGYFAILRNPGFSRGRGEATANFARAAGPLELGIGALLLLLAALVWILPAARSPVRFSPSEVQFLFPAPISRRQLLQYRLLRAQLGLLFGSAMATLFMRPTSFNNSWKFLTGLWLILMTCRIYFTGVSLYREGLRQRGIAGIAQWAPVAIVCGAVAIVAATIYGNWSSLSLSGAPQPSFDELNRLVSSGPVGWILWPFRALTRVPLAVTTTAYSDCTPRRARRADHQLPVGVESRHGVRRERGVDRREAVQRTPGPHAAAREEAPPPRRFSWRRPAVSRPRSSGRT